MVKRITRGIWFHRTIISPSSVSGNGCRLSHRSSYTGHRSRMVLIESTMSAVSVVMNTPTVGGTFHHGWGRRRGMLMYALGVAVHHEIMLLLLLMSHPRGLMLLMGLLLGRGLLLLLLLRVIIVIGRRGLPVIEVWH